MRRAPADKASVDSSARVACGHAVIGVGLLVRRISLPLAALCLAALVLAGASPLLGGPGGPAWLLLTPLALLFAARVLAIAIGAAGWLVFPSEHRAMLAEIASEPHLSA